MQLHATIGAVHVLLDPTLFIKLAEEGVRVAFIGIDFSLRITAPGAAAYRRTLVVLRVVEFDDGDIGTKQLLVAYAGLERAWEGA